MSMIGDQLVSPYMLQVSTPYSILLLTCVKGIVLLIYHIDTCIDMHGAQIICTDCCKMFNDSQ